MAELDSNKKCPVITWQSAPGKKGLKSLGKLSCPHYIKKGDEMEEVVLNITKKIRELEVKQKYGILTAEEEGFLRQLRQMEVKQNG